MKTNLDSIFKTNKESERNGQWFELNEKTGFLIRRFNAMNPHAKGAMAKYYKPYAKQIENDTLSVDKSLEININLFLDVCLVDWKGIEIDGVEVAFDRDTGFKVFQALPDLFDTLWKHANDFKNFREDLGNF
jgi:hypothetical protein